MFSIRPSYVSDENSFNTWSHILVFDVFHESVLHFWWKLVQYKKDGPCQHGKSEQVAPTASKIKHSVATKKPSKKWAMIFSELLFVATKKPSKKWAMIFSELLFIYMFIIMFLKKPPASLLNHSTNFMMMILQQCWLYENFASFNTERGGGRMIRSSFHWPIMLYMCVLDHFKDKKYNFFSWMYEVKNWLKNYFINAYAIS
jgi:hypothetical protein